MDKDIKVMLVILVGLTIVFSIDAYFHRDKFKVGDVVITDYSNEFERKIFYDIIIEVGKENYLTMAANESGHIYSKRQVESKSFLNRRDLAKNPPEFYHNFKKIRKGNEWFRCFS